MKIGGRVMFGRERKAGEEKMVGEGRGDGSWG